MSVVKLSFVSIFLLILISSLSVMAFADVGEEDAAPALVRAENAVVSAYQVVLEVERIDVNASGLLARLNEAGALLASGRVAFRLGEFAEAAHLATLCFEISDSVKNQGDELRVEASGPRFMHLWWTIIGSLTGVLVVFFGSFWSWRVFKRRYHERFLKLKPEVKSDES